MTRAVRVENKGILTGLGKYVGWHDVLRLPAEELLADFGVKLVDHRAGTFALEAQSGTVLRHGERSGLSRLTLDFPFKDVKIG